MTPSNLQGSHLCFQWEGIGKALVCGSGLYPSAVLISGIGVTFWEEEPEGRKEGLPGDQAGLREAIYYGLKRAVSTEALSI